MTNKEFAEHFFENWYWYLLASNCINTFALDLLLDHNGVVPERLMTFACSTIVTVFLHLQITRERKNEHADPSHNELAAGVVSMISAVAIFAWFRGFWNGANLVATVYLASRSVFCAYDNWRLRKDRG